MKRMILFLFGLLLLSARMVEASPLLMVDAEGIVDGYVGENIGSRIVELRLSDRNYRFEVEDDEDISGWFANIPEGLEAYIVGHTEGNIHVSFEGTPLEASEEFIEVTVPDGFIIDKNADDSIGNLSNTPSEKAMYQIRVKTPLAYYERESIVKGKVGKQLTPQKVYVQLENTTCEASMMGHVFESHNGLTPKVVDILSSNVVVIEYTGTPLKKDRSLIHTILLNEDLRCDTDLIVPDRQDVRFDITEEEETPVPPIIEEKPHVFPVTGIE